MSETKRLQDLNSRWRTQAEKYISDICKAAFIIYDLVGGGRFFGGFQNFLVKIEGVSKFCRTRGGLTFIW